jgi:hypothetical protein
VYILLLADWFCILILVTSKGFSDAETTALTHPDINAFSKNDSDCAVAGLGSAITALSLLGKACIAKGMPMGE